MYAFRVSPHVENLIKECAARLITSGVPVSQSVFFFECGGSSRFGYCKKGDAKGASGFEYSIAINKYIVNDKDISDTVAHELLHTIKTAKNHDANWKYWANFVSRNTPFTITVRANIKLQPAAYKNNSRKKVFRVEQYDKNTMNILECPLCHDKIAVKKTVKPDKYGQSEYLCRKCHKPYFFTVPSPSVAYMSAREKQKLVDDIISDRITVSDDDLFLKIMPFVTKNLCNKLFIYYFTTFPEIVNSNLPRREKFRFFLVRYGTSAAYRYFK